MVRGRGRGSSKADKSQRPSLSHAKSSISFSTAASPHSRPRRGPPAVFVSCEVGREHKCKREVLELLHHYYYASRKEADDDEVVDVDNEDEDDGRRWKRVQGLPREEDQKKSSMTLTSSPMTTLETTESATTTTIPSTSSLTLEEELEMLRKGITAEEVLSYQSRNAKRVRCCEKSNNNNNNNDQEDGNNAAAMTMMKSPFAMYDTGMRGMICILCTLPRCEYIPYDTILMQLRKTKSNTKYNDDDNEENAKQLTMRIKDEDSSTFQDQVVAVPTIVVHKHRNEKEVAVEEANSINVPTSQSSILWDPVETVKCIFNDAKQKIDMNDRNTAVTNNIHGNSASGNDRTIMKVSPPGSRFISRILPMQATCYASIEEIKAVSMSLLSRCLPDILQSLRSKRHADTAASTSSFSSSDGRDPSNSSMKAGGCANDQNDARVTFKLEIKRRLCTHLTREEIITAVTPLILGVNGGDDGLVGETSSTNDGANGLGWMGCTFTVNLTDPDFTIRIETCKTLCGISILPRDDWYGNFNLADIHDSTNQNQATHH